MTADDFTSAAIALLRSAVGWQTAIAKRLGIEARTVRRWLQDGRTPAWVDERLRALMGGTGASVWPRDEWVIGDGVTRDARRREYIVHVVAPRFIARVVALDAVGIPEPDEEPADVLSGMVYSMDDLLLCEIDWIDEVDPGQVTHLLEAACDAIEEQTRRGL